MVPDGGGVTLLSSQLSESKDEPNSQPDSSKDNSHRLIDMVGLLRCHFRESRFHFGTTLICLCDGLKHLGKSQTDLIFRWVRGKRVFGLRVQLFDKFGRSRILRDIATHQDIPQSRRIEDRHLFPFSGGISLTDTPVLCGERSRYFLPRLLAYAKYRF